MRNCWLLLILRKVDLSQNHPFVPTSKSSGSMQKCNLCVAVIVFWISFFSSFTTLGKNTLASQWQQRILFKGIIWQVGEPKTLFQRLAQTFLLLLYNICKFSQYRFLVPISRSLDLISLQNPVVIYNLCVIWVLFLLNRPPFRFGVYDFVTDTLYSPASIID